MLLTESELDDLYMGHTAALQDLESTPSFKPYWVQL